MRKEISYVPVVLIGATAMAIAIARELGEEALILEKSCLIGREFVNSYNVSVQEDGFLNEETQDMVERLRRKQAIHNGKLFLPAVSALLFEQVRNYGIRCMFNTLLINVKRDGQEYLVTYYNVSGVGQVRTKLLIDTTSSCETMQSGTSRIENKYLNTLLVSSSRECCLKESANKYLSFEKGFYDNELYMKLQLNPEEEWMEAREKIFTYWMKRDTWLKDWKIVQIASDFQVHPVRKSEELGKMWLWLPSSSEKGILGAYDRGILEGKNLEVV